MDAQVVPPGALRLGDRLDARRHLGGALPRDPEQFRDLLQADRRDPRAAATASGRELAEQYRAKLGEITSPEAWEETFRPWTEQEQRR